jgi:hypothetical protein
MADKFFVCSEVCMSVCFVIFFVNCAFVLFSFFLESHKQNF